MKSKAIITANPKTGNVFTLNTNEDGTPKLGKDGKRYGTYRIQQSVVNMATSMSAPVKRSTLKSISEEVFNNNSDLFKKDTVLEGNILVKESLVKEIGYSLKKAGQEEDAPTCKVGNQDIYRTTVYSEDPNETDVLIQHDNGEEIKAYLESKKTVAALN